MTKMSGVRRADVAMADQQNPCCSETFLETLLEIRSKPLFIDDATSSGGPLFSDYPLRSTMDSGCRCNRRKKEAPREAV
jgi:hypothetical protein